MNQLSHDVDIFASYMNWLEMCLVSVPTTIRYSEYYCDLLH